MKVDPYTSFPCWVTLKDTATGELWIGSANVSQYQWSDGNWSCDCNRLPFFTDGDENGCLGAKRILIVNCDHPDFDYEEWNSDYPPELVREHRP